MMTLRLWHALRHPPFNHPLFWRTVMTRESEAATRHWPVGRAAMLALVLFLCSGVVFPRQLTTITLAAFMIVPCVMLSFTFNGVIYGLIWGVKISSTIARSYESSVFDLLATSPPGGLGAAWAMGTACLYRSRMPGDLSFPETWTIRLFVVIFASMALATTSGAQGPNELVLPVLVNALVLIAAFYTDDMQSIVVGSLVGMLIPMHARNRVDARLWTVGLYLLIQVTTYVSSLLAGFVIIPAVYRQFGVSGWHTEVTMPLAGLIVFYGIREIIISYLWHHLTARLNAIPKELNLITDSRV